MKLIECVPNISEGKDGKIIDSVINTIKDDKKVHLLDVDSGIDTNRTVITFIGEPDAVINVAFNLIKRASELIDMSKHSGEHPRMGSTDVCPLIPIKNISTKECVEYSRKLAKRVASELNIPIFLYEKSATDTERINLANIRKGEYEGMFKKIKQADWKPDFGDSVNNKKSGCTAIGVREFLIAYNVNLNTFDKKIATDIALDIREAGRAKRDKNGKILRDKNSKIIKKPGKLKFCKAVGWYIDEYNQAQVSINLTNYKKTSIHKTFEEIRMQARKRGVRVTGSEIVGLVPKDALLSSGIYYLKKQSRSTALPEGEILNIAIKSLGLSDISNFDKDKKIIENNIIDNSNLLINNNIKSLADITSLGTPTPGGGSISALAGAYGVALGAMVSNLSFQKKDLDKFNKNYISIGENCQKYKDKMLTLIDSDTDAYNKVIEAIRLPKKSDADKKIRLQKITLATIYAADIPMKILEISLKSLKLIHRLVDIANPSSVSDLGVSLYMLYASAKGASMNVIINAKDFDSTLKDKYLDKINYYDKELEDIFSKINIAVYKILND